MNNWLASINPIAIEIGPFRIAWYGIIIGAAMFVAVWLSGREAVKRGFEDDLITDLALWVLPAGIIGARLYYVLFELSTYIQNPIRIFYVWEGGLAIYGGVIGGIIALIAYCEKKDLSMWLLMDIILPNVLLAQAIGRWGNFINQEAHGGEVSRKFLENLFLPEFIIEGMNVGGTYYHPTFLYESIWNVIGFIVIYFLRKKANFLRRGESAMLYFAWYGLGRFFIEGMRTDSLYIGPIRVSQALSLALFIGAIGFVIYQRYYTYPIPPYYTEGIQPDVDFKQKKAAYESKQKENKED